MEKFNVYHDYLNLSNIMNGRKDEAAVSTGRSTKVWYGQPVRTSGFQEFDPKKMSEFERYSKCRYTNETERHSETVGCMFTKTKADSTDNFRIRSMDNLSSISTSRSTAAVDNLCMLLQGNLKTTEEKRCARVPFSNDVGRAVTSSVQPLRKLSSRNDVGFRSSVCSATQLPIVSEVRPVNKTLPDIYQQFTQDTRYKKVGHPEYLKSDVGVIKHELTAEKQKTFTRSSQFCSFCKRNGERPQYYKSHPLKEYGKVVCPVLRSFRCPICNSTGDNAHTVTYCPFGSGQASMMTAARTTRKSCGCVREKVNKRCHHKI